MFASRRLASRFIPMVLFLGSVLSGVMASAQVRDPAELPLAADDPAHPGTDR